MSKQILAIDTETKSFKTLDVIDTVKQENEVHIFYEDCLAPIMLSLDDFDALVDGHIVEIHKGEVAIKFL